MRDAARLVTAIRDRSKVDAFARELAGMLGIDPNDVQREVRRAASRGSATSVVRSVPASAGLPDARDPRLSLERETLKLVVQHPGAIAPSLAEVDEDDFTHPAYRAVWSVVATTGGVDTADAQWAVRLQNSTSDERLRELFTALAVETVHTSKEPTPAYAAQHVHRLRELTALRRIADLKSRLQRTNPVDDATEYNKMFGELVALEQHRRDLRERALAGE
jgi:DNA primase